MTYGAIAFSTAFTFGAPISEGQPPPTDVVEDVVENGTWVKVEIDPVENVRIYILI